MRDSARYASSAVFNSVQGVAGLVVTAALGYLFYKKVSIDVDGLFNSKLSDAEKKEKIDAKLVGFPEIQQACEAIMATSVSKDVDTYLDCVHSKSSEVADLGMIPIAAIALAFGFTRMSKGLAYGNLALNTVKGKLTYNFKKALSTSGSVLPEALDINGIDVSRDASPSQPCFDIHNGYNPHASISLAQGEKIYTEPGVMLAKDSGILMESAMSLSARRALSGESMAAVTFTNESEAPQSLVITPKTNGEIVEIDMAVEQRILCENGAFFASTSPVDVDVIRTGDFSLATFSGLGRTMQSIAQKDNMPARVLINSSGQVFIKDLKENERLDVQGPAVLAMSDTVTLRLHEVKGIFSKMTAGEGAFMLEVTGPGKVWMTSGNNLSGGKSLARTVMNRFIPG